MESLRELYKIGLGPSSSHTMGPAKAARLFRDRVPEAHAFRATLYGSLAASGRGHLTDAAIVSVLSPKKCDIVWEKNKELPLHPNGMYFEALDANGGAMRSWTVYSVGGGALLDTGIERTAVYPYDSMKAILDKCDMEGKSLWNIVEEHEGPSILEYLNDILSAMEESIRNGLGNEGVLPGELNLTRKASSYHSKASQMKGYFQKTGLIFSYALAVSEENACGHEIVTAPTCGSAGVLPAVLFFLKKFQKTGPEKLLRALATAAIIGTLVKKNASISGAEVGCQGEIGVACSMAAGAATYAMGGTPHQIEYAAEMGLEHHLGLTCDPIGGLVQIPCIERNAIAAVRAMDCASYVLLSDGRHLIPFDEVVVTMAQTGRDMKRCYRETSEGGLALVHGRGKKGR